MSNKRCIALPPVICACLIVQSLWLQETPQRTAISPTFIHQQSNEQALSLVQAGQYPEARVLLEEHLARKLKDRGSAEPTLARVVFLLAFVSSALGDSPKAEELLGRLADLERLVGREFIPGLDRFEDWPEAIFWPRERHAAAAGVLEPFVALEEKVLGPDHAAVVVDQSGLAVAWAYLDRAEEAGDLAERASRKAPEALKWDPDMLALVLRNSGKAFFRIGRYAQAEDSLVRCLQALEKTTSALRERYLATVRITLADAYRMQGKYREAEPHYREVWDSWQSSQVRPPPKDRVLDVYEGYASVLRALGREDEAESLAHKMALPDEGPLRMSLSQAEGFYLEKEYSQAKSLAWQMLQGARKDTPASNVELSRLFLLLGKISVVEKNLSQAERYFDRAAACLQSPSSAGGLMAAENFGVFAKREAFRTSTHELGALYEEILQCLKSGFPNQPILLRYSSLLAGLYLQQGALDRAESVLESASRVADKAHSADPVEFAGLLAHRAHLHLSKGQIEQASKLALRAIEKASAPSAAGHPGAQQVMLQSLQELLRISALQGNRTEALRYGEAAASLAEKAFARDGRLLARSLMQVGTEFLTLLGDLRGEIFVRRAASVAEAALPPNDPELAGYRRFLVQLLQRHGQLMEAEEILTRMEDLSRKSGDLENAAYALSEKVVLYLDNCRFQEAESVLLEVLEIQEKIFGAEHPALADCFLALSMCQAAGGRMRDAERALDRVHELEKRSGRAFVPGVGVFGEIYLRDPREAILKGKESALRAVVDLEGKVLGRKHIATACTRSYLAYFQAELGQLREAEENAVAALEVLKAQTQVDPGTLSAVLTVLGFSLAAVDRLAEAEAILGKALEMTFQAGRSHGIPMIHRVLADVYRRQGAHPEAAALYKPLYERFVSRLSQGQPPYLPRDELTKFFDEYARVLGELGERPRAEEVLRQKSQLLQEPAVPTPRPAVDRAGDREAGQIENLIALGESCQGSGKLDEAEAYFEQALSMTDRSQLAGRQTALDLLLRLNQLYSQQPDPKFYRALLCVEQALPLAEELEGPESRMAGELLLDLGGKYTECWRFPEAETLLRRALAVAEKHLSPNDRGLVPYLEGLEDLFLLQDRQSEANVLDRKIEALGGKSGEPSGGQRIRRLVTTIDRWYSTEKYAQAEQAARNALRDLRATSGAAGTQRFELSLFLARACREQGKNEEAEKAFQGCLEICRQFGLNKVYVVRALHRLGQLYEKMGKTEEAQRVFVECFPLAIEAYELEPLGPNNPVGYPARCLGDLYRRQKKYAEAAKYYDALWEVFRKGLPAKVIHGEFRRLSEEHLAFLRESGDVEKANEVSRQLKVLLKEPGH